MSLCFDCGDAELIFVPKCGDAAVGNAKVLFFAGSTWEEVKNEIDEVNGLFQAFWRAQNSVANGQSSPSAAIQKQDDIANFLKSYIDPTTTNPTQHLTQVYHVHGKKWSFVRSDRLRNHVRSYQLERAHLVSNARTLAEGRRQLDRQGLIEEFTKVRDQIFQDLRSGINFEGVLYQDGFDVDISDTIDAGWADWINAVNRDLIYSNNDNANFDITAGAQLLRAYGGYGVTLGYSPRENKYGIGAQANALVSLAEAKATINGYLPHRDGWHALIEYGQPQISGTGTRPNVDFGYFRFRCELHFIGMVGASVMGTVGLEYAPDGNGQTIARGASAGAKGEVSAGAFAGAEAGGTIKGMFEWDNPEKRRSSGEHGWASILEVGARLSGQAGIGASATFQIALDAGTGKLYAHAEASVCLGLGGSGGLLAAVGLNTIFDFIQYVYHELKKHNYGFLNFITQEAFQAIVALTIRVIEVGADAIQDVAQAIRDGLAVLTQPFVDAQRAEDFARNVKNNINSVYFASPEVKGAILYKLSETFTFSLEEHQEAAILQVINTCQSWREWEQVVERISPTGAKTSSVEGMRRINWIIDGGNNQRLLTLLGEIRGRSATPNVAVARYDRTISSIMLA